MPEFISNFLNNYVINFVVKLVCALAILLIGFAIAKGVVKLVKKGKGFAKLDVNLQLFITNTVGIGIKVIAFVTAIIVLGVPNTAIATALASAGLAIGLALQGGLGNIASGIIMMFCKPFHIGDFISGGGVTGVVKDIGIYYSTVTTPDNQDVVVPNSSLANATVTNFSTQENRRVDFDFNVAYSSDIDLTRKVLLATAAMNDLVLKDPSPEVFVAEHGESGLVVKLRIWCKSGDYWTVYFDMWEDVKKSFDKFNIEIPYKHVDVIVENK